MAGGVALVFAVAVALFGFGRWFRAVGAARSGGGGATAIRLTVSGLAVTLALGLLGEAYVSGMGSMWMTSGFVVGVWLVAAFAEGRPWAAVPEGMAWVRWAGGAVDFVLAVAMVGGAAYVLAETMFRPGSAEADVFPQLCYGLGAAAGCLSGVTGRRSRVLLAAVLLLCVVGIGAGLGAALPGSGGVAALRRLHEPGYFSMANVVLVTALEWFAASLLFGLWFSWRLSWRPVVSDSAGRSRGLRLGGLAVFPVLAVVLAFYGLCLRMYVPDLNPDEVWTGPSLWGMPAGLAVLPVLGFFGVFAVCACQCLDALFGRTEQREAEGGVADSSGSQASTSWGQGPAGSTPGELVDSRWIQGLLNRSAVGLAAGIAASFLRLAYAGMRIASLLIAAWFGWFLLARVARPRATRRSVVVSVCAGSAMLTLIWSLDSLAPGPELPAVVAVLATSCASGWMALRRTKGPVTK